MRCLQQAVSLLRYHSLFGEDVQGILQMAYPGIRKPAAKYGILDYSSLVAL